MIDRFVIRTLGHETFEWMLRHRSTLMVFALLADLAMFAGIFWLVFVCWWSH